MAKTRRKGAPPIDLEDLYLTTDIVQVRINKGVEEDGLKAALRRVEGPFVFDQLIESMGDPMRALEVTET